MRIGLSLVFCVLLTATAARGQTTQPVAVADPTQAIGMLRTELIDAFNKGDLDRLLAHLDPDVVVTWQNGEVCRGPQAVRAFYERMMVGPNRVVKKISADPKVDDRHVYGDWAVSWGAMNDSFELNDGSSFQFNSRFTSTIAKRGDEWKVTSFHASVNAFENPILTLVAKKVGLWSAIGGAVGGILVGVVIGLFWTRRRPAGEPVRT